MPSFTVDTSELRRLAVDLGHAAAGAAVQVRATTQRAALNIKRDMQEEASGSPHFNRVPASITYDTWEDRDGITAEIGPEIGKAQGSLAFLAYNGTATMGPIFSDPIGALRRESETYQRYLADAVAADLL